MKTRFGAKDPKSMMLRFHTQTAGVSLTAQQPEVNTVRTTLEALAAILGGTQSLHTNAHDEALALPTAASAQLALRIQQVLGYEIGIGDTVDPLAGSYYLESLTDDIETKVQQYLAKVDSLGGSMRAIEEGFFQSEIQKSAYEFQLQVESKERTIVGVNQFKSDSHEKVQLQKVSEQSRDEQIKRLQAIKAGRDNARVDQQLKRLADSANTNENLLPIILDCVESYASVGEISNTLRRVWGEYRENIVL